VRKFIALNKKIAHIAELRRFRLTPLRPIVLQSRSETLNRSFSRRSLAGFFRLSRFAFLTTLRDGMNLVAKEYVAAQDPMTPRDRSLELRRRGLRAQHCRDRQSNDPDAVAEALQTALGMPLGERLERWEATMTSLCGESFLEATAANWRSLRTRHQCSRSRYSHSSTICSRPSVRCYFEIISGAEMIHA